MAMNYVGRMAPSPTGAQHVGNARTFLAAWLVCRQASGRMLLRIEDLDTPRTKQGATQQAIDDLRWLGLDWDGLGTDTNYTIQSDREPRYREILDQLKLQELVYPCTCTRSEVDSAASAPHEPVLDGVVYGGTCSHRTANDAAFLERQGLDFAWRFRMPEKIQSFHDQKYGVQILDAREQLGDFVIARSYGVTAYQLAVVVDDHDSGVNHIVRGNDLIFSTFRQQAIYTALGWPLPAWLHLPLVTGKDGRRLAKRHGDTRLSTYREQGVEPERIIAYLGRSLGIICGETVSTQELLRLVGSEHSWITRSTDSAIVFNGFDD